MRNARLPLIIQSKVIKGDGRGRVLGFPTANLSLQTKQNISCKRKLFRFTYINGYWYPVALNIGYNPTFETARGLHCEAHIVGFEGDLYEKTITLYIISRNREEIKFVGADALVRQLKKDIKHAKNKAAEYMTDNAAMLDKFAGLTL